MRQKFMSTTLPEKSAKWSSRPSVADGKVKSLTEVPAEKMRVETRKKKTSKTNARDHFMGDLISRNSEEVVKHQDGV